MDQNRMNHVAQQELDITCKNGDLASVIMSSVPLFEDGHFVGAFAMFSDITALRETEQRFRKIFEEAAIGMSLGDMSGHLLDVNPAFLKMLGYHKDEVVQKDFKDFLHPDDAAPSDQLFQGIGKGDTGFLLSGESLPAQG